MHWINYLITGSNLRRNWVNSKAFIITAATQDRCGDFRGSFVLSISNDFIDPHGNAACIQLFPRLQLPAGSAYNSFRLKTSE